MVSKGLCSHNCFNPIIEFRGNYSVNNDVGTLAALLMAACYFWYSEERTGRGRKPPRPLLLVPNVTVHPSTANVPITVLLYNGPWLYGFNVLLRG